MFVMHTINKELVYRMHKQIFQINMKNTDHTTEKWAKF